MPCPTGVDQQHKLCKFTIAAHVLTDAAQLHGDARLPWTAACRGRRAAPGGCAILVLGARMRELDARAWQRLQAGVLVSMVCSVPACSRGKRFALLATRNMAPELYVHVQASWSKQKERCAKHSL